MVHTDINPQKLVSKHGTMVEVPTKKELSQGSMLKKGLIRIKHLYWLYYIHLPFCLMSHFDSFCLHFLVLITFILSFYGLVKYIL